MAMPKRVANNAAIMTMITTVKAAMAVMRDAVATLEAQPADLDAGYTEDEVAAQYAATDRIVEAFHLLDRLLTNR